jgi:hypothetical protein
MLDFPAAFDKPTIERLERNAQENTTRTAIYRRLVLALMTKSSVELRAAAAQSLETAEEFLSTAEGLRKAIERHEAEIELLRSKAIPGLSAPVVSILSLPSSRSSATTITPLALQLL